MNDFTLILYLAGLAIAITVIHSFLKQAGRDEYAYLVLLVGLTLALMEIIPLIAELFNQVQSVFYLY